MKLSLFVPKEQLILSAAHLSAAGISVMPLSPEDRFEEKLADTDWVFFSEGIPLLSSAAHKETRRLLSESLRQGKPVFACLSPDAPVTPKCALLMTELLQFSSAAAATAEGAVEILGLDPLSEEGEDPAVTLARALCETFGLSFSLIFDPEEKRSVLFSGDSYDIIESDSMERAIAAIFRS